MENICLVENIKILCKQYNITVPQLERILTLSPGLISRWAKTTPSLDRLIDVAHYFNVPIDTLLNNTINISNKVSNSEEGKLISLLIQRTIYDQISWHLLDFENGELSLIQQIESFFTDSNKKEYDCFYSPFDIGYFILLSEHFDDKLSLSLYILPDRHSDMSLQSNNYEQLYNLYNSILEKGKSELNSIKISRFIYKFINEFPNDKYNSESELTV